METQHQSYQTRIAFLSLCTIFFLASCGTRKNTTTVQSAASNLSGTQITSSGVSVSDSTGTVSSATPGTTYPPQFNVAIPGLPGQTVGSVYAGLTGLDAAAARAVARVGVYTLSFTIGSSVAAAGTSVSYSLTLPATVNFRPEANSSCLASLSGSLVAGSTATACVEFTQATVGANITPSVLPLTFVIGTLTQKLYVLVLPSGTLSMQLVGIYGSSTSIPPVVVRRKQFHTPSNTSNTMEVIASEFDVRILQDGNAISNAAVSFVLSGAGTVAATGVGTYHVTVRVPGPQTLIMNANGVVTNQVIAIARQYSMMYTANIPEYGYDMCASPFNEKVGAIFTANLPGVFNIGIQGSSGGISNLAVSGSGQVFSPQYAPAPSTDAAFGSKCIGNLTVSVPANIPLGAITGRPVILKCPDLWQTLLFDGLFNDIM